MKSFFLISSLVCLYQSCISQTKAELNSDLSMFSNIKSEVLVDAVLKEGKLVRVKSFPSKHIQPRDVDVWLPQDYSNKKKYAVLYMHDGQMLFDSTATWNKQEWKVDEHSSQLMRESKTKDFIVVGIHSLSDTRWLDLFPEKTMNHMDRVNRDFINAVAKTQNTILNGDNYLLFLVKELKPFIDSNYATIPNKENTYVAGSSMGGLMSIYAVCEYPNIFGGAACISTHWPGARPMDNNPYPKAIFKYIKKKLPKSKTHKVYFDYGTETLDQYYPKYASKVDSIFLSKGYTDINYKNLKFEGADHSENSWNKRLSVPLTFLLKQ